MKLSAAIEHALVKGYYSIDNPYMCNAMHSLGLTRHVHYIEEMVDSIAPGEYTLWGALYESYRHLINGKAEADDFAFTSELYVWWVFDLKRKGL